MFTQRANLCGHRHSLNRGRVCWGKEHAHQDQMFRELNGTLQNSTPMATLK